jgi:hypothetical protein
MCARSTTSSSWQSRRAAAGRPKQSRRSATQVSSLEAWLHGLVSWPVHTRPCTAFSSIIMECRWRSAPAAAHAPRRRQPPAARPCCTRRPAGQAAAWDHGGRAMGSGGCTGHQPRGHHCRQVGREQRRLLHHRHRQVLGSRTLAMPWHQQSGTRCMPPSKLTCCAQARRHRRGAPRPGPQAQRPHRRHQ